jgi:uncharacterized membrane protein YfcA
MVFVRLRSGGYLYSRFAKARQGILILPTDILFYCVAGVAVILVGLAKGGFAGLGAAAMPLPALVMDPVAGAGMLLPILMLQDVESVWAFRRSYDRRTRLLTLPGEAIGIFLAWLLASVINEDAVRGFVGVIALAFGTYLLLPLMGMQMKLTGRVRLHKPDCPCGRPSVPNLGVVTQLPAFGVCGDLIDILYDHQLDEGARICGAGSV